jgi:hypothetical protein
MPATSSRPFVRKYDKGGEEIWTRQLGTTTYDRASSVRVDRDVWTHQHGTDRVDNALAVCVDGDDHIFVAGWTMGKLPGNKLLGAIDAYLMRLAP